MTDIHFVVSRERFEEVFSIDDSFHLGEVTNTALYEYMCQFVFDDEAGVYLDVEAARKLFKGVKRKEMPALSASFYKALREGLVNPTSGG